MVRFKITAIISNKVYSMEYDGIKGESFLNSTGKSIPQIYKPLDYTVPGKVYQVPVSNYKKNHSLLHYIKQLLSSLLTTKTKQLLSTISLNSMKTLQSVYSEESMAILTNSIDLDDALSQAQEYNIPLLQVLILTAEGERVIKEKILLNFTVAHLVNENFVLYGDWEARTEVIQALPEGQDVGNGMDSREGIYVRKGEYLYAFLPMWQINAAEQSTLQENLLKVRNLYYQMNSREPTSFSHLSPPGQSEISASSSMFGPNRSYHEGARDNFNDSDEEEWEAAPGQQLQG